MDFRKGTEELHYCGNRFGLAHSTYISQIQILPSVESTLNVPATKAKRIRTHFTKEMNSVGGLYSSPLLYSTFSVGQGLSQRLPAAGPYV
jgi:hypothetical protein